MDVNWNQRDLLLYAVGVRSFSIKQNERSLTNHLNTADQIGARRDELRTLYELDPNWHPFPTYPLVLGLKGNHTDLNNFNDMKDGGGKTPGLPPLNPVSRVGTWGRGQVRGREAEADVAADLG